MEIAGVYINIVDNSNKQIARREIFLVHIDSTMLKISHTQEGYDELELTVLSLQIDNHIKGATHAVMVSENNEYFVTLVNTWYLISYLLLNSYHAPILEKTNHFYICQLFADYKMIM